MEFLTNNYGLIIGGVLIITEVIVRLTPSKKDNSIFNKIKLVVDFILPNLKKDLNRFK